jgi:threonine dehydratase
MNHEISIVEILKARPNVYRFLKPTPLRAHPLLSECLGFDCYIKHENHNPTGAFKIRGGLNFMAHFAARQPRRGIITATRGNHGQSLAMAARLHGIACTIVVPYGNNPEKNDAMRAMGAELIEHGHDFDEARLLAEQLQQTRDLHYVSPGDEPLLVNGVGTYALEIFEELPDADCIIVPIGGGSGICGVLAVAEAINSRVEVIGVQAEQAPCIYLSWKKGELVETPSASTFADGLATRVPFRMTFEYFKNRIHDMVLVSEEEIRQSILLLLRCTHNLAEGAGAAALAAAIQMRQKLTSKKVVLILSGGNLDGATLKWVLSSS